ncbi:MAG: MBL fold metallo-hydrolase [Saccharopolyspora sp.]|uniref:MBL fold metallo-hydrolase n=1 Tax=Saccharopolyspora TaxID=1835 RepID=UPI00190939CC|nr:MULTISPECIES: MBL fold metallo-hydrolase [unclassified Saccharopolyspora]MBK0869537.1 MBL fold metallo-hydrolase [Saccharopolyspora sp. HNM0986]MBQ6640093.1 MBL fold metallo-hydrolase [Saccharopolyspora sp.]
MNASRVVQAAAGTYLVTGSQTNWVILVEDDSVTLIDGGYPRDADAVEASVHEVGHRMRDVEAVLVTHAHVDHIGSLPWLSRKYGIPVHADPVEVGHVRREYLQQATPKDILANAWRPRVLPWAAHVLGAGALKPCAVPTAEPFPRQGALDLPGRPVPVSTHGHTSGHSAFHLPHNGVLISGDALITGHGTSGVRGPQMLLPMFHHDRARAWQALDSLEELEADVILPGHGPMWNEPLGKALGKARENAARHLG